MASKADVCIFCGENPCACGKPAKKSPVKRVAPVAPPPVQTVPEVKQVRSRPDLEIEEVLEVYALQNLANAGLLSTATQTEHADKLGVKLKVSERSAVWKMQHGQG